MRSRVCVIVSLAFALATVTAAPVVQAVPAATFEAGENASIALNFDDARRIYAAAAASPAEPAKDRAAAYRQLGVLAWRLDGNAQAAKKAFADALAVARTSARRTARLPVSTRTNASMMRPCPPPRLRSPLLHRGLNVRPPSFPSPTRSAQN
ncbi:MAG: hypothetical protein KBA31_18545 [Alphaproteobacteria bacterium]|nr:hypothetical protein [Alphaproteobacteria bacterium]